MIETFTLLAYVLGHTPTPPSVEDFRVTSPAFQQAHISQRYTCSGANAPVPVSWQHVPRETKSLALVLLDPDAPKGTAYHWGVYNIPPHEHSIAANSALATQDKVAVNSWGHQRYDGPCSAQGKHHYVLRLYALDETLQSSKDITVSQLRNEIKSHIVNSTELETEF